ncbi:hypothetical protein GWI33_014890 [Rhynchophorus ferrugineus]|uniref:C2H2-type domain-containing protein n=1 Tax=Rhynchophorus ferrugineus TaxID=354439 RepID=A0A834M8N8_RHYFE|nr:hypothetical protein GWI33_014890 [Rhynchophorus ferrugineus]
MLVGIKRISVTVAGRAIRTEPIYDVMLNTNAEKNGRFFVRIASTARNKNIVNILNASAERASNINPTCADIKNTNVTEYDRSAVPTVNMPHIKRAILRPTFIDDTIKTPKRSKVTIDTRKPLIKILRVEDLKNDDIVPRIKKELGFGFPLQKSMGMVTLNVADKNLHIDSKQEPVMLRGRGGTTAEKIFSISGDHDVIKQEACESSDSLSSVLTKGDDKCSVETFHELVVVPDDHMDIDKESNGNDDDLTELKDDQRIIIVKEGYGVFSQERRNRFLNMKADDVTPKKEKVPKCYSDLSEFGELKDQIRCSSCGILFDREIFTKHQTLCKGNKKKNYHHFYYLSDIADKENRAAPLKSKKRKMKNAKEDNQPVELFMCPRCTKSYRLRHSLTRHIKFECGQEPRYPCELCPRKFKHKYDLTVHMRGRHNLLKDQTNTKENNIISRKSLEKETNGDAVYLGNVIE